MSVLAFLVLSSVPLWTERTLNSAKLTELPDFQPLVREVVSSVVNITSEARERGVGLVTRSGSGFVLSADGYVLTNAHLVQRAIHITVHAPAGTAEDFPAQLVGLDTAVDLALLKVEGAKTLRPLPLGDSDLLQVGEWVVAVGNPYGLENAVSAGIVSAKNRRDVAPGGKPGLHDFLQTDAAINPGSSGGPLLNLRGEVVGVSSAIGVLGQGIGFAVPINLMKSVLGELKTKGRVVRPTLGLSFMREMTPALARSYGLAHAQGAVVVQIQEGGAAAGADIELGDIIVSFDAKPVRDAPELLLLAAQRGVGQQVALGVLRSGKLRVIPMTLVEDPQAMPKPGTREALPNLAGVGLEISDLTGELRANQRILETQGVIVLDVDDEGTAAEAGLEPGDILTKLNDKPLKDAKQLRAGMASSKPGDVLRLVVRRGTERLLVAILVP